MSAHIFISFFVTVASYCLETSSRPHNKCKTSGNSEEKFDEICIAIATSELSAASSSACVSGVDHNHHDNHYPDPQVLVKVHESGDVLCQHYTEDVEDIVVHLQN